MNKLLLLFIFLFVSCSTVNTDFLKSECQKLEERKIKLENHELYLRKKIAEQENRLSDLREEVYKKDPNEGFNL